MSKKTKTKTTVTPYDPNAVKQAQGALDSGFAQAQATQARFLPTIFGAIDNIGKMIASPPAYQTSARDQLNKTISGDYLSPETNPWAGGIADQIAKRTQGSYNASFGASGRSHGGLAALLSSQGVGDALGQFYGGIYDTERGRQMQATGMAPTFNQDEFTGINNLLPAVNNASMMPLNTANAYAGGMGSLIAPYASTKTTQKTGGLGNVISQGIGLASMIGGAAMGIPPGMLPMGGAGGGFSNPFGSGGLGGLMELPMPQINSGLPPGFRING